MTHRPTMDRRIAALTLLGAAAFLPSCFLFGQFGKMAEADIHFRNEGVRVNVRTVALSLSMYARDHKGLYPGRPNWIGDLASSYYLPNNRLPPNPWSIMDEHTQANVPSLGPLPRMTNEAFEAPPVGTELGPGEVPKSVLYQGFTYGALLYDVSPDRKACVLYGVGQEGDKAVVVEAHVRGRR